MRVVIGITYYILLILGAFACVLLSLPAAITLPIHSLFVIRWRRAWMCATSELFFDFGGALLSLLCGVKVFVYTASPQLVDDKGFMVIANHRTRVDFMFNWCYTSLVRSNKDLRVIIKDALRYVPVFGWGVQLMMYIFLSRKRDEDVPYITKAVQYLMNTGRHPSIFIFPEGTDLSVSNVAKSNAFSKERGLPVLTQVLHPKAGGVSTCLSCMRGKGLALHDMTFIYNDHKQGTRANEYALMQGKFPKEMHFIVRRYEIDQLPTDKAGLDSWICDVFMHKEKLLSEFYKNNSKAPSVASSQADYQAAEASAPIATGVVTEDGRTQWPPLLNQPDSSVRGLLALLVWIVLMLIAFALFSWFRWLCAVVIIVCMSARAVNGFDSLELSLHADMVAREAERQKSKSSSGKMKAQ